MSIAWDIFVGGHPTDAYVPPEPPPAVLTRQFDDTLVVADTVGSAHEVGAPSGDSWTRTLDDVVGVTDPGFRRFSTLDGYRNLLPWAQETLEGDTLPEGVGAHSAGQTMSIDSSWSFDGTRSLRVQAASGANNSTGAMWVMTTGGPETVTAGVTYVFRAAVRRVSGSTAAQFSVKWRDSTGAFLGSEVTLASVPSGSGNWELFEVPAVAPEGAVYVYTIVRWTGSTPISSDVLQVDSVGVWAPVAA